MVVRLSSAALKASYRLETYEHVNSTNILAGEFAKNGDQGKLWIVAQGQLSGRGRRGNQWLSPKGNLYASLLLMEDLMPQNAATLGFVAGVSLIEAISQHKRIIPPNMSDDAILLKWPNDLLVAGAKLTGILLELVPLPSNQQALVIGLGVNVASSPTTMPYPTASLQHIGYQMTAGQLFETLSETWSINYQLWNKGNNLSAIRDKWLSNAANLGGRVNIMVNGELISGIFETIDEQCKFVIYQDNGQRIAISAGEVHFSDQVFSARQ